MVAVLLAIPVPGIAQFTPPEPSTRGFYTFQISSRTLDAPLFDAGATGRVRLLFGQGMGAVGTLALWLERGFPNVTTDFGVEWRDLPFQRGYLRLNGGDFLLRPLLPARAAVTAASSRSLYPLQGIRLQRMGSRSQWSVYLGEARRFRTLMGRPAERPTLFGMKYLRRFGVHHLGFAFTGVAKPTFVIDQGARSLTGIVSGTYYQDLSPWIGLLAEAHTTDGSFGGRAGSLFKFPSGEVSTMLYAFGRRFPFVFPLYRPGEGGVTVSSQLQLSEFTSLFAHIDYVLATRVDERSDLRAEVGLGKSLGSNRPHLYMSYSHNEVDFEDSLTPSPGRSVDLFALSLTQSSSEQLMSLRLEYMFQSAGSQPDQGQAHLFFRRLLGSRSFLDATLDGLLDENGQYRLTADTSFERPLWRRFNYLVGLGATYREGGFRTTGEGLVRLGLSRRITQSGLSVRVELAQPFSIGLPRTRDPGIRLALDVGHRLVWKDLERLQDSFLPRFPSRRFGAIEGTVRFEGRGVGRVTIYVNGEPRDITSSNGRFRVRRVPLGLATVRLDIREFETEYGVVGGAARQVEILPRRTVEVDFELAVMRYIQGAIVICEGEAVRPLANTEVTLVGDGVRRTIQTSRVGGFQFDELTPGRYEVVLAPLQPGDEPLTFPVDLSQDVAGFLIRINCN